MKNESREAEIAERLAKATPGPWRRNGKHGVVSVQSHPLCEVSAPFHRQTQSGTGYDEELIAAAPADLRYLLDRNRELEALATGLAKERDNWMESAAQFSRNADFYCGLVTGIGAQFGEAAYISDDGSKQQDVLCLKVPDLVSALLSKAAKSQEVI